MADNVSAGKTFLLPGAISDSFATSENIPYNCIYASSHDIEYRVFKAFSCNHSQNQFIEILSAAKLIGRRFAHAYLASPALLAFSPFILGLLFGWFSCKIWNKFSNMDCNNPLSKQHCTQGETYSTNLGNIYNSLRQFKVYVNNFKISIIQRVVKFFTSVLSISENEKSQFDTAKKQLQSNNETKRESGVEISNVPRHVAVIMDGNRRFGKSKYGSITKGHWDGSKKLVEFSKWCLAEKIQIVTVYAFSTENWSRDADEVSALMKIFAKYCDELREEAVKKGIKIDVLSTETDQFPDEVKTGIKRMVEETSNGDKLLMNVCLSYGSRGEIVHACKKVASEILKGNLTLDDIKEDELGKRLLTGCTPDPDVVIRTSGEVRLSNFLLWQLAYTEMFFLDVQWPEITKEHLLNVIKSYANGRKRRFGK